MSTSYLVNNFNEMVIIDGVIQTISESAEVAQRVKQMLQSYEDDFFLDRLHGIPYFQQIYTKPVDLGLVESIIKAEILALSGVAEITFFEMDFASQSRRLTIQTIITTTFGTSEEVTV